MNYMQFTREETYQFSALKTVGQSKAEIEMFLADINPPLAEK